MRYSYYLMLFLLVFVLALLSYIFFFYEKEVNNKKIINKEKSFFNIDTIKKEQDLILDTIVIIKDTSFLIKEEENFLRHLDTAKKYLYVRELTGNNDGYEVEKFLKSVGRKKGDAWCAAFVSYCLEVNDAFPKVRSGLARHFKLKESIKANDVLLGIKEIPPGSLLIWERGNTIFGHVGFVVEWKKQKGKTIEGNTSSGNQGSQFDGDGVFQRTRTIQPANHFRITSFTLVNYGD